jgi:hypothetical protein
MDDSAGKARQTPGEVPRLMAPTGIAGLVLRRWYVAVVGVLATIILCGLAVTMVPPKYKAQAVVVLIPPAVSPASSNASGPNPFLSIGTLVGLNDVLAQALTGGLAAQTLAKEGVTGTYNVTTNPLSNGPLLLISGEGMTPAAAKSIVQHVAALVPRTLTQLQTAAGVMSAQYYVTSSVINPPDRATKSRKSQIRAAIAGGAAGLVLTLLALAGTDKLLDRRSRHDRRRHDQPADDADTAREASVLPVRLPAASEKVRAAVPSSGRRTRIRAARR